MSLLKLKDMKDRDLLLNFIRYYKGLPALWNPKCPEYRDNEIKKKSFMLLLNQFREIYPTATISDVKKKINSLRSNFRRYHEKAKTGQPATVYWYNDMRFIMGDEPVDTEIDVEASYLELEMNPLHEQAEENMMEALDTSNDAENSSENPEFLNIQGDKHHIEHYSTPKFKESRSNCTTIFKYGDQEEDSPRIASCGDEFDLWGKVVAAELRKMQPTQQIFAKKAIYDILMEGQLGSLNKDSVQINKASDQCNYDINTDPSNNTVNNSLENIT